MQRKRDGLGSDYNWHEGKGVEKVQKAPMFPIRLRQFLGIGKEPEGLEHLDLKT